MFDNPQAARGAYAWWKRSHKNNASNPDIRAAQCVQCGACEAKCPQSIPISRWMPVIHQALGENGPYVKSLDE
jgi:predicted aldo/keto reductase-like oxidoreductase